MIKGGGLGAGLLGVTEFESFGIMRLRVVRVRVRLGMNARVRRVTGSLFHEVIRVIYGAIY